MSVVRQDPTTKDWVIIASGRARRPHPVQKTGRPGAAEARDPFCPFCPGHEESTPPEVLRIPDPAGSGWTVRVVTNRFPALDREDRPYRAEDGPLFREINGVGAHEVIVETPAHERPMGLMAEAEVERVLQAYQARYRALREDPRIKWIIVFKNHGQGAGTSLPHPHSQLVATPVPPMQIRRKYEVATAHYDETGRCLYCDLVAEEVRRKVRVVRETERFVVIHPYASRVPFETWILPTRHQPSFGRASQEDLAALAQVLRETLRALYQGLGNPDFNYVLHSAPTEDENKPYYLWHVQILPRLTTIAGFELGSGIFITTTLPEESAALARHLLSRREAG